MGWHLNETIERDYYDELGGKDTFFEAIEVSGSAISNCVSIRQEGSVVMLTGTQLRDLARILLEWERRT